MRSVQRRLALQPRGRLRRAADGQLRAAGSEHEIADIWAEQKRVQLHDAIEHDKRRTKKSKEIAFKISLPKVSLQPLLRRFRASSRRQKQWLLVATGLVVVVGGISSGYQLLHKRHSASPSRPQVDSAAIPGNAKPDFTTLLPEGKDSSSIGGWGRVSPPGQAPAYAYADTVNGVHVTVTQQQLPESFKADTAASLAQLAQQYSASDKLTVKGTTAYVGTSVKGPQSLLWSEYGLLILIKSDSKISSDQWVNYLYSLQPAD